MPELAGLFSHLSSARPSAVASSAEVQATHRMSKIRVWNYVNGGAFSGGHNLCENSLWRCPVNAGEVVVHKVERQRKFVILESIREAGEAAIAHPKRQI